MKHPMHTRRVAGLGGAALLVLMACARLSAAEHPVLGILDEELQRSVTLLKTADGTKPYFLQYTVTDRQRTLLSTTLGAVTARSTDHNRMLDVDVRCGAYQLDNTHQVRDDPLSGLSMFQGWADLPLNDDPLATRHAIWLETDRLFKEAVNRLAQVKANVKVKVEEEDQSDDFSRERPQVQIGPWVQQTCPEDIMIQRLKMLSRKFREAPQIYDSSVALSGEVSNQLLVNTEGSRIQHGRGWWRIGIQASTIADDGMELWQYKSFDAHSPEGLPDDATLQRAVQQVIEEVLALRAAPVVEPYTGPAILMNRATGVFFHEIFGHRIEGHRQKDVEEGQTFAKKVGQSVLPPFLSVVDDPTQRRFGDVDLNGYYQFDQEGVPGQPARVVVSGVLETFLLSRSPTRGFTQSNGHGRRQPGRQVVARQGNLIIESSKRVPLPELRRMLIEECQRQNKPYGLLFDDISGGFTTTRRTGMQAFKVLPIVVYRVYVDGRPDELVRGADVVGTPLTCFSRILATGDDPAVFNGTCGAESGMVPVSAIAPSILVEQIEIEKKAKAQDRPPILPAPIAPQEG